MMGEPFRIGVPREGRRGPAASLDHGERSNPFEDGVGHALRYFAFRIGAWLASRLPAAVGEGAARVGGVIALALASRKRTVVRRNLARAVGEGPDLDAVVRAAFLSYARYWVETFRLSRSSAGEMLGRVESLGTDLLEQALARGKGVVMVTPHFGSYEVGMVWAGTRGYRITTVAEVLRPRALFEWFARRREMWGLTLVPAVPGYAAHRRLVEALARGEGVALVADRDLARRGVWVEFFGEPTTFPKGPATLVAQTEAALLSGAVYQTGKGYRLEWGEIPFERTGDLWADVTSISQRIAEALEAIVLRAPEQWHLFCTNWPSDEPDLPPRPRRVGPLP